MNPDEIVVHIVDRERCYVVLDFLRVSICQARVSAHLHPHGQVLALDKAGADVLRVRIADLWFLLAADALRWRVAGFCGCLFNRSSVMLHQNRIIDIALKGVIDCEHVQSVTIGSQLDSIRHSRREAVNKMLCGLPVALTYAVVANKLGVSVHCDPRPKIASVGIALRKFFRDVRLFCREEAPYFVALNALAREIYEGFIQVLRTGVTEFNQQFSNSVFGNTGHANRRTDRIAFYQRSNHLSLFLGV